MAALCEWREWDLTGLEVTYVHFDYRFTVDVWSSARGLGIIFETEVTLCVPGFEKRRLHLEQHATLGPLLKLLHKPVSSLRASSEGECVLCFEDGTELHCEPHPMYEAWEATGSGELAGIALLCGPGGGLPWRG